MEGVNSRFLPTLQFGWLHFYFDIPAPPNQPVLAICWFPSWLVPVVVEQHLWVSLELTALCCINDLSSPTVTIPCSGEVSFPGWFPSFLSNSEKCSTHKKHGGMRCSHVLLQSWGASGGLSSFSFLFPPVTSGTNWPCPSNQRNVRLARGSKYISWQQDKSKSTEKFMQREYFLYIQLCLVLRCPYQSNYCMGDADWLEEPVHSGSVMESGRSSASWSGRR